MTDRRGAAPEWLAEQLFIALDCFAGLTDPETGPVPTDRPGFNQVVAFASGASSDPAIGRAIATNLVVARNLRRLAPRFASHAMPRQAAASTVPLGVRQGPGWRIRIQASAAEPTDTYVLIELDDRDARPVRLVAFAGSGHGVAVNLPGATDGTIQLLEEASSPLVAILKDRDSEVFLL
jgi:hypothetical protein